jgi:hypothetical protein
MTIVNECIMTLGLESAEITLRGARQSPDGRELYSSITMSSNCESMTLMNVVVPASIIARYAKRTWRVRPGMASDTRRRSTS